LIGGTEHGRTLRPGDPHYRPLRELLGDVAARLQRPLLIAETGAEGADRAPWFRYVADEALAALRAGLPLEGLCLYPILDYPGWSNDRHCPTGLYGVADGCARRVRHDELSQAIDRAQEELLQELQLQTSS
jgi:hypothetical protein